MNRREKREESGYDDAYLALARTVRTWFVAYGIGVPVLILSQDKLFDRVARSGIAPDVARLFLGGVFAQVASAIVYKAAMWHLYRAEFDPAAKRKLFFRFFDWLSDAFWVEMLIDSVTATLFAVGTIRMLRLLV